VSFQRRIPERKERMKPAEGSTNIGKSVTIRGELNATEDLFLDGIFDGTVNLPESRLTVGPNAQISAELHVRDLVVFGTIDGNVFASGRIELRQTAVLRGDLTAGRLSIEESATMRGRVELTGHPAYVSSQATPTEPAL
jgi:cytoskeletal protein CcmA (bactofilin family)